MERKTSLRTGLALATLIAVGFFAYRQRHLFKGFGSAMGHARWVWVGVAFVAELASMLPLAETQRVVLRTAGVEAPFVEMTTMTLASNAIATSVPAGLAVAEGYAFGRYKRFGASAGVAAWTELAAGAIEFASLAAIALAGALIDVHRIPFTIIPILAVVFVGSAAAAELFRRPDVLCDVVDRTDDLARKRVKMIGRASKRLREIADQIDEVDPSFVAWLLAYGLSGLNWLLDIVCLACTFLAFGARIPWAAIFLAFAATKIISSIGITPGGLGLVEGGMVGIFAAFKTKATVAVPAVVIYRTLTLIGLVGIGWLCVPILSAQQKR